MRMREIRNTNMKDRSAKDSRTGHQDNNGCSGGNEHVSHITWLNDLSSLTSSTIENELVDGEPAADHKQCHTKGGFGCLGNGWGRRMSLSLI